MSTYKMISIISEIEAIRKEVEVGLCHRINLVIMKETIIIISRRWRPNNLLWRMGAAWSVWKPSLNPGKAACARYLKLREGRHCLQMAASFAIAKDVIRWTSSSKNGRRWKQSSSRMVMGNSPGKGRDCSIPTMILTMRTRRMSSRGRELVDMAL